MPLTSPYLPTPENVLWARHAISHPELLVDEPDFELLIDIAWRVLKADRSAKDYARRTANALRSIFPDDAA